MQVCRNQDPELKPLPNPVDSGGRTPRPRVCGLYDVVSLLVQEKQPQVIWSIMIAVVIRSNVFLVI